MSGPVASIPLASIPLRRSPTDLVPLLKGTIETLQEQARALDVSLAIDAAPGLPLADVDAEKIAWAVATLVGNAFRYVRRGTRRLPGGSINVRLRAGGAKEGGAKDGGAEQAGADGGSVIVSVEDDGPGIPPNKCANLFRRGQGVTHGTGLALMLIQDVVTAHGGAVEREEQVRRLRERDDGHAAVAGNRSRARSAAGVTSVVATTTETSAEYCPGLRRPFERPRLAKTRLTSPRGIMPIAMASRFEPRGAPKTHASFPTTAATVRSSTRRSVCGCPRALKSARIPMRTKKTGTSHDEIGST